LYCALEESPLTDDAEGRENTENFARTVKEGRRPGLTLQREGSAVELQSWGLELIERIRVTAELLDAQRCDDTHMRALKTPVGKLRSAELTPSARVLKDNGGSFSAFGLRQSQLHAADFRARPPSVEERAYFDALARTSLAEQEEMERTQAGDFDQFITDYRSRTPRQLCE
jgi:glutamate--cysteine ligase